MKGSCSAQRRFGSDVISAPSGARLTSTGTNFILRRHQAVVITPSTLSGFSENLCKESRSPPSVSRRENSTAGKIEPASTCPTGRCTFEQHGRSKPRIEP